jgi:RNA polymerase sigma factor (sigma-70 family)
MTHPGTPGNADAPGPPLAGPAANRPPAAGPVPGGHGPGSEHEFSCFYREHIRRLVAYLIYQGATAHLAADLAQDAMTTAYRRWPEIKSPRAYVYKVAGRAFLRHALDAPELTVGEVPEPASVLPRPEEAEAWLQTQQIIEVLRALPPRQRQVLALTIDGWSPAEISELLGIDPAAVRSNLMKARRSADEHRRRIGEEAP